MPKEKFYITTAIDYVNASPHIGHALEKVQADVAARYQRILGKDVFFLTGADEHGAKIVRAAQKAGKTPANFCEENSEKFKLLAQKLNISNDDFIRTSDEKRHFPAAQKIWNIINAKGDIYKKHYKGLYCVGHEAFITEKDLVGGKCVLHDSEPETIEEENYFFRLTRYAGKIKEAILKEELKIVPEERKNETLAFINEGLEDISISRPAKDISWGVPVPADASQTMYVWFEALVNYISGLGFAGADDKKFRKFWPADIHFIGKDILRFHAIIWPAILLSAGLPLPRTIFAHGFITVGGKKMSKTLGNVVDPFYYIDNYGADALRYYLLRKIPNFEDGDFTDEKFKAAHEGELVNGLGNFVSRVSRMAIQYFNGAISKPSDEKLAEIPLRKHFLISNEDLSREDIETGLLPAFINAKIQPDYDKAMLTLRFNSALSSVFELLKVLDVYVDEYKPFKLIAEDKEKTEAIIWNLCFGAVKVGEFLRPFLGETSEKILKIFEFDEKTGGFFVSSHSPLFPRK